MGKFKALSTHDATALAKEIKYMISKMGAPPLSDYEYTGHFFKLKDKTRAEQGRISFSDAKTGPQAKTHCPEMVKIFRERGLCSTLVSNSICVAAALLLCCSSDNKGFSFDEKT
jgi:hypothetical protein